MFSLLQRKDKNKNKSVATSIIIGDDFFHFFSVDITNDKKISLIDEHKENFSSYTELANKLNSYVHRNNLVGISCNWVLRPSDYKLMLVDIPLVPKEEQLSAISWDVLEKLEKNSEEVVIDTLSIPTDTGNAKSDKLFVVVADKNKLINYASLIEASGIKLNLIDIAEQSISSVTQLIASSGDSTAIITTLFGNLHLLICQNGGVILARKLSLLQKQNTYDGVKQDLAKKILPQETTKQESAFTISDDDRDLQQINSTKGSIRNLSDLDNNAPGDPIKKNTTSLLVNEINRSFEYCYSTLGVQKPESLLIPDEPYLHSVIEELQKSDYKGLSIFDVANYIENISENTPEILVGLGGAMRFVNE